MKKKYAIICFIALTLLSPLAHSAVNVIDVKGIVTNYNQITITGSGFDSGPNVILFDDFEKGTLNEDVALDSPQIGIWTKHGMIPPTLANTAHSGQKSIEIYIASDNRADQKMKQIQKHFENPVHEVFISYWVRIPEGTNFPTALEPKAPAIQSAWKFLWLMDGEKGYLGDDDLVFPSAVGSNFYAGGNDGFIYNGAPKSWKTQFNISSSWWTFDGWMRISGWFHIDEGDRNPAPAPDATDASVFDSKLRIEFLTEGIGEIVNSSDHVRIGDGDDNAYDNNISQWTQVNFPGWIRTGLENSAANVPNCRPVYDDIYIATGDNSQARVEIGNAPAWTDCTNKTLLVPTKWTSTEITANVYQGSFKDGNAYIYVIDKDGNVNQNGFKVTIGEVKVLPPGATPNARLN